MSEEGVDIGTLSPQQLQSLGETLQENLQQLGDSFQKLQGAVSRFHTSGTALEALAEQPAGARHVRETLRVRPLSPRLTASRTPGKPMLVPLTQSLYAPGKLGDTGKVLIDIGTGYFVEARARGLCARCASTAVLTRRALCSTRPRTAWHTAAAKCCCCARTWTSWGRCALFHFVRYVCASLELRRSSPSSAAS